MIRFLFFLILLSGALLAFMGTVALALHLLGRSLAAMKEHFRGGKEGAGEAPLLMDPVYGTIVLPASGRVIPPPESPAMATAAAGKKEGKEPAGRIPPGIPERTPARAPGEARPDFATAAARCRDLALVTTDLAGRITSCNSGGEKLLGIDRRRDTGARITKFLAGADSAFIRDLTGPAANEGVKTLECAPPADPAGSPGGGGAAGAGGTRGAARAACLDGRPLRSLWVTATALRDEEGRVEGFLFTAHGRTGKPEALPVS